MQWSVPRHMRVRRSLVKRFDEKHVVATMQTRHAKWFGAAVSFRGAAGLYFEREMFYLTTHSTHFIYGYTASDIWLRTILIVRKETRCRHIGYSYRLTARVLLYAPSHRQDNTYHGLCYTSRGALAGTRNSSMGLYFIPPDTISGARACVDV